MFVRRSIHQRQFLVRQSLTCCHPLSSTGWSLWRRIIIRLFLVLISSLSSHCVVCVHDETSPGSSHVRRTDHWNDAGVENMNMGVIQETPTTRDPSSSSSVPSSSMEYTNNNSNNNNTGPYYQVGQGVVDRCDWLWNEFETVTAWMEPTIRADRYHHQVTDSSVYYRATAHLFWKDFVGGNWSQRLLWLLLPMEEENDEYRTYTWVLGDLHLLNFGAWKNRRGDMVFGMNDYDEGTIHDFQVDIMRLVISIYDHTRKVLGNEEAVGRVLHRFLVEYVATVRGYVGNEHALTADLTLETATGSLKDFLQRLEDDKDYSRESQIKKYTTLDKEGRWKLDAGTIKKPKHKLVELDAETKVKVQAAFSGTQYGATMNRFVGSGRWREESFQVLDVAARVNTGVGSFGVDRYFVLVACGSCNQVGMVLLDVKYQPPGSFRDVLSPSDSAWFDHYFAHAGSRVTEAHRKLTAFTDPWTGWILLDNDRPFSVRERSPWKEDFELDLLRTESSLIGFVHQLAISVATSHVRGNVADAPDDFKNTIEQLLGDSRSFQTWNDIVIDTAAAYHAQVQIDFECFRSRVELHYPQ